MQRPNDLLADLRRIGLAPGATPDQLKVAWRRAVSQLHPDRHGEGADGGLAEVNAAFQRLQAFHRRHGRLPSAGDAPTASPTRPRPRTRRGRWLLGTAAVAAVTFLMWPQIEPPPALPSASSPLAIPNTAAPFPEESAPLGLRAERIEVGLTAAEVERLAGPPMFRSAERWEYGPSEIRFTDGKTSGWYSSPLRPLPVGDVDTFPPRTK